VKAVLASIITTYDQDVSVWWYGCYQTEVGAGGWLVIWYQAPTVSAAAEEGCTNSGTVTYLCHM